MIDSQERWDRHFLKRALLASEMSKDPSTRVGAIIVGMDRVQRSDGWNGFPRGIDDSPQRLADRDLKLRLIVHAERNALLNAARTGVALLGCTLYLAATDDSGEIWSGCPCTACVLEIIQVGITHVVGYPFKPSPSKWWEDIEFAEALLAEAGVVYREVKL